MIHKTLLAISSSSVNASLKNASANMAINLGILELLVPRTTG